MNIKMMMQRLRQPIASSSLIGRALQIEALQTVLDETQSKQGRSVLLSGEAGIGKSRLLREFVAGVDTARIRVLQGSCRENDTGLAYGPLIDALRGYFMPDPSPKMANLPGPLAEQLVALLPELAPVQANLSTPPTLSPELEKRRLFEMLLQFLRHLSAPGALLLIIEDIHWCDETSLEFLQLLAHRLHGTLPIFLLLTTRPQADAPVRVERLRLHIQWSSNSSSISSRAC